MRGQILTHVSNFNLPSLSILTGGYDGDFPNEFVLSEMHVYDPSNDSWSTRDFLPDNPERRRAGAAFVTAGDRMYLSHGVSQGHRVGSVIHSKIDVYDPILDAWNPDGILPDGPNPRGHCCGAVTENNFCIASGRIDSDARFNRLMVLPVDCFDLETRTWTGYGDIPQGRAGSNCATTCDGRLM